MERLQNRDQAALNLTGCHLLKLRNNDNTGYGTVGYSTLQRLPITRDLSPSTKSDKLARF